MAKKNYFKTTSKVVGGLAMVLALVFGLVLAGCKTDDDSGSSGGGSVDLPTALKNTTYKSTGGKTFVFNEKTVTVSGFNSSVDGERSVTDVSENQGDVQIKLEGLSSTSYVSYQGAVSDAAAPNKVYGQSSLSGEYYKQ